MTAVNANAPQNPPEHMQSQNVPPGNHAQPNDTSFEKRMAELARREKEVQKLKESLKDHVSLASIKDRAKTDRNSVLKELGMDDLIPQDANDPLTALQKRIDAMEAEKEQARQQQEQQKYKENLNERLKSKQDDFEFIHLLNLQDRVFDAIHKHYSETGEMPDEFGVASQIESLVQEQLNSVKGAKKLADWFKSAAQDNKPVHPLDKSQILNSSDRAATPPAPQEKPRNKYDEIQALAQYINFDK